MKIADDTHLHGAAEGDAVDLLRDMVDKKAFTRITPAKNGAIRAHKP